MKKFDFLSGPKLFVIAFVAVFLFSVTMVKATTTIGNDIATLGSVGIGTLTPEAKLHVKNTGNTLITFLEGMTPQLRFTNTLASTGNKNWDLYSFGDTFRGSIVPDNWAGGDTNWLEVKRNGETTVTSVGFPNGNVGIGEITPTEKLDINGGDIKITGTGPDIRFSNTTGTLDNKNWKIGASDDTMSITVASDDWAGGSSWFNAIRNGLVIDTVSVNATKFGIGNGLQTPTQRFQVQGGIRQVPDGAKPSCNADARGTTWFTEGGAGVKDAYEICAKDVGDAYAWRTIY